MGLGDHDPVTGDDVSCFRPSGRSPDQVVRGGRELGLTVTAGLGDGELQELFSWSVVEPVHHLARHDLVADGVIGHDLDVHLVVDDLADLLGAAVGQLHPGAVGKAPEHHSDFLAKLVDEDGRGARVVQRAGHLPQRLAHQAGLQTDVAVPHLAFDLGTGHQRGHRVDDQDVQRTGPDQHVGDLQRLFTGVGLGDQQCIGIHSELLGIFGVQGVLGVDERGDSAGGLGVGHRMQRDGGLTRGLGTVDLDDATAGQTADAECDIECDRTGGDDRDRRPHLLAEPHHRALAEVLVDLRERQFQGFLAIGGLLRHGGHLSGSRCVTGFRSVSRDGRSGHRQVLLVSPRPS